MGTMLGKRPECAGNVRVLIDLHPNLARSVFGPSPGEVLNQTRGTVLYFYYAYLLGSLWAIMLIFALLRAVGIPSDPVIKAVLIGALVYTEDDWLIGVILIFVGVWLLSALIFRVVFFPVRSDGQAEWRWKK